MSDNRIQDTLQVIMELAAGEFSARATIGEGKDEVDALMTGINMLAEELEARFKDNDRLVSELQQKLDVISVQSDTILSLSTPILVIWEQILVLPLIGNLDTKRASHLSEQLLKKISEMQAQVVIIDVTGIALVDTAIAKHLIDTVSAVRLLGATCILTGVRPEVAQNITMIGVDLQEIVTKHSLYAGLRTALGMVGPSKSPLAVTK